MANASSADSESNSTLFPSASYMASEPTALTKNKIKQPVKCREGGGGGPRGVQFPPPPPQPFYWSQREKKNKIKNSLECQLERVGSRVDALKVNKPFGRRRAVDAVDRQKVGYQTLDGILVETIGPTRGADHRLQSGKRGAVVTEQAHLL